MPEDDFSLSGKSLLITGGTGTFGRAFVEKVLSEYDPKRLVVLSRDEFKQYEMAHRFNGPNVRYLIGDVRDGEGNIIAGARAPDGRFLDSARLLAHGPPALPGAARSDETANTTLAVVATNAALSRSAASELAAASSAAFYRRITPAGTSYDGDIVFALCRHEGLSVPLVQVESLAVRVLETAIERAVRLA